MSTRSGKRIHNSFYENSLKPEAELGYRSEKKTRSKRIKENLEDINLTLLKSKKRENYVSFPTDDESAGDSAIAKEPECKTSRSSRKNILKEQNVTIPDIDSLEPTTEPKKPVRLTRRTRKFSENAAEDIPGSKNNEAATMEAPEKPKSKRNKKTKEVSDQNTEEVVAPVQTRKSKRKKKKSLSNSLIIEEVLKKDKKNAVNQSNISIDSFQSAAGSPQKIVVNEVVKEEESLNNTSNQEIKLNSKIKKATHDINDDITSPSTSITENINSPVHKKNNKKGKQKKNKSRKDSTFETDEGAIYHVITDKIESTINKLDVKDSTFDKSDMNITRSANKKKSSVTSAETTLEKESHIGNDVVSKKQSNKRKSSVKSNTSFSTTKEFDADFRKEEQIAIDNIDTECSLQKRVLRIRKSSVKDSHFTFTKMDEMVTEEKDIEMNASKTKKRKSSVKDFTPLNSAFEKNSDIEHTNIHKKKSSIKDIVLNSPLKINEEVNTTYEKDAAASTSSTRKRKSSMKDTNSTFTPTSMKGINTACQKDIEEDSKSTKSHRSSLKESAISFTFAAKDINSPLEKHDTIKLASTKDTTYDKNDDEPVPQNFTFEKRKSITNKAEGNRKSVIASEKLDNTYDKSVIASEKLDNTYDKSVIASEKLDNTYDKSVIASEKLDNTYDKSVIASEKLDNTYDKSVIASEKLDNTYDKSVIASEKLDNTHDKSPSPSLNETSEITSTFNKSLELNNISNGIKDTRKSVINSEKLNNTFDKSPALSLNDTSDNSNQNSTFNNSLVQKDKRKSVINADKLNNTYDKSPTLSLNETSDNFNKISCFNGSLELKDRRKSALNSDKLNNTYDKSPALLLNETSDKSNHNSTYNRSLDINITTDSVKDKRKSVINSENLNNTYDKSPALSFNETSNKSDQNNISNKSKKQQNTTFDKDTKLDSTFDKSNSKSSLVTSDSSNNGTIGNDMSHVSITSDESTDNIINTTPLLIESSMDDSQILDGTKKAESPVVQPQTPLKREGTFTKESSEVVEKSPNNKTPTKRMSLPSPGYTPYLPRSTNKEKTILNVTRSIEKGRRSSLVDIAPRQTKVMFCSPVNNPGVLTQQKRKVIKSNLKGSNKSFVFEEQAARPAPRKRSYTQSDADDARSKRKRLADDIQNSVDRLSRPRTSSASAKLEPSTPSKKHGTPSKTKPDAKVPRTKLPNFAALHQRQFDKMESLDQCQERKAKRAKQLLTPTGTLTLMDRSVKGPSPEQQAQKEPKTQGTPTKRFQTQLPTIDSIKPGFTRFGFKLNMEANPFSIPTKNVEVKTKENKPNALKREPTLPSLVGATSLRREAAKQLVLREKSFTGKRNVKRNENRTVIKGVRTNRRFELQMKMRNIE